MKQMAMWRFDFEDICRKYRRLAWSLFNLSVACQRASLAMKKLGRAMERKDG